MRKFLTSKAKMIATLVAIGAGFKLELIQLNNQSKSLKRYREVKKQLF